MKYSEVSRIDSWAKHSEASKACNPMQATASVLRGAHKCYHREESEQFSVTEIFLFLQQLGSLLVTGARGANARRPVMANKRELAHVCRHLRVDKAWRTRGNVALRLVSVSTTC